MKSNNLILLCLLTLICCFSCEKEDDPAVYFDPPLSATEGIEQDEIRLLVRPYEGNDSVVLTIGFGDDDSKRVKVNWGDDNFLHSYKGGDIKHKYINPDKEEYIITIKVPGIKSFEYTHQESISKTKSVAFGKCPSLESLHASTYNNVYENFDLSQCPQFNGEISFHTYTNKFNFNGLKNFTDIFFVCNRIITDIEMVDMNFIRLRLGINYDYNDEKINRFYIKNTREDIENIEISFQTKGDKRYPILAGDLRFEISKTDHLYLGGMSLNNELNLSGFEKIVLLRTTNCDYPGIRMPQNMTGIELRNPRLSDYHPSDQKLESLDFSKCPDMEYITLQGFSNLKTVNIEGLQNLISFHISDCPNANIIGEIPNSESKNMPKSKESEKNIPIENYMINLKANSKN